MGRDTGRLYSCDYRGGCCSVESAPRPDFPLDVSQCLGISANSKNAVGDLTKAHKPQLLAQ